MLGDRSEVDKDIFGEKKTTIGEEGQLTRRGGQALQNETISAKTLPPNSPASDISGYAIARNWERESKSLERKLACNKETLCT